MASVVLLTACCVWLALSARFAARRPGEAWAWGASAWLASAGVCSFSASLVGAVDREDRNDE